MELMTCPYRTCRHTFSSESLKYEMTKYGKVFLCPKCGMPIHYIKYHEVENKKCRMSKKDRRKAKKATLNIITSAKLKNA